jgi:hypothetical protein
VPVLNTAYILLILHIKIRNLQKAAGAVTGRSAVILGIAVQKSAMPSI